MYTNTRSSSLRLHLVSFRASFILFFPSSRLLRRRELNFREDGIRWAYSSFLGFFLLLCVCVCVCVCVYVCVCVCELTKRVYIKHFLSQSNYSNIIN